jgi:hypothetical protein
VYQVLAASAGQTRCADESSSRLPDSIHFDQLLRGRFDGRRRILDAGGDTYHRAGRRLG